MLATSISVQAVGPRNSGSCWLLAEATFSSWPCGPPNVTACFFKASKGEPPSDMGVSILHNMITDLTSCPFCRILLARSKSLVPCTLKGKSMNTRRRGLWGHVQVSPQKSSVISTGWSHRIYTQLKAMNLFFIPFPATSSHLEQLINRTYVLEFMFIGIKFPSVQFSQLFLPDYIFLMLTQPLEYYTSFLFCVIRERKTFFFLPLSC